MAIKSKDELGVLHAALANALLTRVKSEYCSSADLAVAAKFLKDNDVVAVVPKDGAKSETAELEAALSHRKRKHKATITQDDIDTALREVSFSGQLQ